MDTDQKKKTALVVSLALIAASILAQNYVLISGGKEALEAGIIYIIAPLANNAALIFAGFYIATEFKKSSALIFKVFMYLTMLAQLIGVVMFSKENSVILIVLTVLTFGFLNVLTFAKDLGKKRSLFFAYATIVLKVISLVVNIIIICNSDIAEVGKTVVNIIFIWIGYIMMSVALVTVIQLKYLDKAQRHTK